MSKTITQTIRGHNLKVTVLVLLLAVLIERHAEVVQRLGGGRLR